MNLYCVVVTFLLFDISEQFCDIIRQLLFTLIIVVLILYSVCCIMCDDNKWCAMLCVYCVWVDGVCFVWMTDFFYFCLWIMIYWMKVDSVIFWCVGYEFDGYIDAGKNIVKFEYTCIQWWATEICFRNIGLWPWKIDMSITMYKSEWTWATKMRMALLQVSGTQHLPGLHIKLFSSASSCPKSLLQINSKVN